MKAKHFLKVTCFNLHCQYQFFIYQYSKSGLKQEQSDFSSPFEAANTKAVLFNL